jgi:hypothetical protein
MWQPPAAAFPLATPAAALPHLNNLILLKLWLVGPHALDHTALQRAFFATVALLRSKLDSKWIQCFCRSRQKENFHYILIQLRRLPF